jgi:hypothetical protein
MSHTQPGDYMPREYHTAADEQLDKRLRIVAALDIAFVAMAIFWSALMARLVADPLEWATWKNVSASPGLFDYPFLLLWMLPLTGLACAWILTKGGHKKLAVWSAGFPLMYLSTIVACFYAVPLFRN